ncbi:MAG: hypothetical protein ABIJ83_02910 [Patescibacteria group bacterium]
MQNEDLQQIAKIVSDNNDVLLEKMDEKIKNNNDVLLEKMDEKIKNNNGVLLEKMDEKIKNNNDVLLEKMDEKIEDLARMINHEFNEINKKMDKGFDSLKNRIKNIENGQENIEMKFNNVAYHFEVIELQKRVETLETKANIQFSLPANDRTPPPRLIFLLA